MTGPIVRVGHTMDFDTVRGTTVMFGGHGDVPYANLGDTWQWYGAQTGTANVFGSGSGCGCPALDLAPVANARPLIGTTAQATVNNIPLHINFVYIGWSDAAWGPFTLPMALDSLGMPGCAVHVSLDSGPFFPASSGGSSNYGLPLPNWSGLIGLRFYLQAGAAAPGVNAANLIASNGLEWVVGNQ